MNINNLAIQIKTDTDLFGLTSDNQSLVTAILKLDNPVIICENKLTDDAKFIDSNLYGLTEIINSNGNMQIKLIRENLVTLSETKTMHKTSVKHWNSMTPDQLIQGLPGTILNELYTSSNICWVEMLTFTCLQFPTLEL